LNFFGCEKNPLPGPAAGWQILAADLHPGFGSGFFLHPARGRLRSVALNPLPAICQFCETLDSSVISFVVQVEVGIQIQRRFFADRENSSQENVNSAAKNVVLRLTFCRF
jgi:hypothetical protein